MVDKERVKTAIREILIAIGDDPDREGLLETPDRVARMYEEIFAGLHKDARDEVKIFKEECHEEMILVKDIPLYSVCEHHLLPFVGIAHVAYIPRKGKIVGLSKLARIVDTIAKNKKMEKEYETYSLYIKSVNRDGLPYMIIANAVPEIEHEVNNILNQIVEFHVDIETDGKNVTPYIVYDTGRWPIEMGSGFEKFISSLAIRVALINISNLPRPNFLIIDEGWGTMDSVNLGQVKLLLQFLRSNFDFIIVISHLDFIKDAVDHLIEVKKDNGISSVNFV